MRIRRMIGLGIVIAALVLAVITTPIPVGAQDGGGLSEEQLVLLDRVVQARELFESYDSYREDVEIIDAQEIVITLGDQSRRTIQHEAASLTIIANGSNTQADITVEFSDVTVRPNGQEVTTLYSVGGEARLVDGVLYLNALYDGAVPDDAYPLPEGWFVVEDVGASDLFSSMGLDDLADDENASPFTDADFMRANAADVTIQAKTLADSTPVDKITVTFDLAGLQAAMSETQDGANLLTQVLLDRLDAASGAVMTVQLDADDHPLRVDMTLRMTASDVDAHNELSAEQFAEGIMLDFSFELTTQQVISQVNEPFDPITAPVD
ncbi:MAG: hypothetical protein JXQ72_01580 [Anaerolineae bacterium]|nr:hypothetical protein [Anaerolineae bacterium]